MKNEDGLEVDRERIYKTAIRCLPTKFPPAVPRIPYDALPCPPKLYFKFGGVQLFISTAVLLIR